MHPTMEEVLNNEHIVKFTAGHTNQYLERLCRHDTDNTSRRLFDLLVIAALEYRRDWIFTGHPSVICYANEHLAQLDSMGIDNIEDLLKNTTVVQNNLALLGHERFEFREFIHLHHTAVDYFMIHGGVEELNSPTESTSSS